MSNAPEALRAARNLVRPDSNRGALCPINACATAIFVKDRQHRCVMLNDECCRLLGHARKVLLGKTNYDFIPKDHADRIWEKEERIFATGEGRYDEETLTDRKGATRTFSTTKSLFVDRGGGAWLVGVVSDITAHQRAIDEGRFMKTLLEAQLEATIAGILIVDAQGRFLKSNSAFRAMWGIPPEIIASKSDAKALRWVTHLLVDPDAFLARVNYLYHHRREKSHDEIALRDGRFFDRYSAPVLGQDGSYYGRLWNFRDVTEYRNYAALRSEIKKRRELDALKDQFIGTVSHELRTPLSVVRSGVDTLRGGVAGALKPEQKEIADLCARNILRLNKMITNLLDISRLESGTAKARLRSLDLRSLLTDLETNFRMLGRGREISIDVESPKTLPRVRGDPELIGEVLYNLLDNAARFARRTVRVEVRRDHGAIAGRTAAGVRVDVVDDGPGIPRDRIDRLFNKFYQVERAIGSGYKGTGLGLAICKEIMTLHGSTIAVESKPGRGARFHFFLPEAARRPAARGRTAADDTRG
ncbi:MAG: ATP-binding protein [Elusimicrobiota bacterium]